MGYTLVSVVERPEVCVSLVERKQRLHITWISDNLGGRRVCYPTPSNGITFTIRPSRQKQPMHGMSNL